MKPLQDLTDDQFSHRVQLAVRQLPDAPPAWQERALQLFTPQTSQPADAVAVLARWVRATLTFDSWAAPVLAHGMRSQRSPTRHLLYSAEGRDVDLRITPSAEHFDVSGQVLGPDESGHVELVLSSGAADSIHRGSLDGLGEFHISAVPAGRFTLTLHVGERPIVVQVLEVGVPGP